MPSIRLATWNSGGEAHGRDAELVNAVNLANATAPAVELVAIQEARLAWLPPGRIRAILSGGAAPFATFAVPPDHVGELGPGQNLAVGKKKAFLVAWDTAGPNALAPVAPAARISLAPVALPAPNGVEAYIDGLPYGNKQKAELRLAARNMRPPVRKEFALAAGGRLYFYTWHAELQANWGNASYPSIALAANPFAGPGMYFAFEFFQNSDPFRADLAAVTNQDLILIAGDFNVTGADLNHNAAALFPHFEAVSDNLSHVMAYSPSHALALAQPWHHVTPYAPHCIITTEVQW
jgi:hypothetical protein